jgi:hypothetical protein
MATIKPRLKDYNNIFEFIKDYLFWLKTSRNIKRIIKRCRHGNM